MGQVRQVRFDPSLETVRSKIQVDPAAKLMRQKPKPVLEDRDDNAGEADPA